MTTTYGAPVVTTVCVWNRDGQVAHTDVFFRSLARLLPLFDPFQGAELSPFLAAIDRETDASGGPRQ